MAAIFLALGMVLVLGCGDHGVQDSTLGNFNLTVCLEGRDGGMVTSDPPGITCGSDCVEEYREDSAVTLTASANTGSTFAGWSGGDCTGTGTCTVMVTATTAVTATFTLDQQTPSVSEPLAIESFGTVMIAWGQRVSYDPEDRPPGNSLPTIKRAYELGYGGIELDIRVTEDLVPVLMHDATIDRTTDGSGRLADITFSELQSLTLGAWEGQPTRVPSLAEALLVNGSRGRVLLDARVPAAHAEALARAVGQVDFDELLLDLSLYSIDDGVEFARHLPCARIFVKQYVNPDAVSHAFIDAVAEAGLAGIMIQVPLWNEPIDGLVDYVHAKGIGIVLYVHGGFPRVDPPEHMGDSLGNMVNAGADAILTTRHDLFSPVER